MNKDQAYHQIALACLKALREPSNVSAESPAQALYNTIDQAFNQQHALLMAELADCYERLKRISALDPAQHSLSDAQAIAHRDNTSH